MTTGKTTIPLTSRLTAYVTREEGAAELRISPTTWDEMVSAKQIPPPIRLGKTGTILRWRWANVDKALSNLETDSHQAEQEPYFRGVSSGQAKDIKREIA